MKNTIMETTINEYYVSLEVAKLLKEAGFDMEGMSYYQNGIFYHYSINRGRIIIINQNSAPNYMEQYSAPTLEVAQKWLRVVKGIHLYVRPILDEHKYVVTVVVDDLTWGQVNDNNGISKRFNTYEEAQEAGIKKALEIILHKE